MLDNNKHLKQNRNSRDIVPKKSRDCRKKKNPIEDEEHRKLRRTEQNQNYLAIP